VSNALENHEDLKQLIEREYALSIIGAHLVVNDVYYLDSAGALQKGRLAAPLNQPTPESLGPPVNHQMYWSGSPPHYANGSPIPKLGAGTVSLPIGETTYIRHLSNKPPEGFATYSLLVEHYVSLISAPAEQKFGVSARTGATYDVPPDTSPFKVRDTFSARAEINDLNQLVANDRIAVIGLGGTGAFVLDFIVKTPVATIDAYDFDTFKVHNGFRLPGGVPMDQFGHPKTEVLRRKYEPFRHGLTFHNKRVGAGDEDFFADTTFGFVCIDDGAARSEICEMLTRLGIEFIDVGMGVEKEEGSLDGLIRTTLFTPETAAKAIKEVPLDRRTEEGAYRTFVQIAELNALNAAIAVMRYKQLRGFYTDDAGYWHSLVTIGSSNWIGEA
jgi:molybdopterin/thiamine biosynthesis adenylyltransferase